MKQAVARMIILSIAGIVLLAPVRADTEPGTGPAFHERGEITDVDATHNRIEFADNQGVSFLVDTSRSTITLPGPQPPGATVADLVAGMKVEIDGSGAGKSRIDAAQIRVLPFNASLGRPAASQAEVAGAAGTAGMLNGILTGTAGVFSRKIRVTVNGIEYAVDVPKQAAVRINNVAVSVHGLPRGSQITVAGVWEANGRLRADGVDVTRQ